VRHYPCHVCVQCGCARLALTYGLCVAGVMRHVGCADVGGVASLSECWGYGGVAVELAISVCRVVRVLGLAGEWLQL